MLLLLIPIAWLVLVLLVLAACHSAARSEEHAEQAAGERTLPVFELPGVTVWDAPDPASTRPLAARIAGRQRPRRQASRRAGRVLHNDQQRADVAGSRSG